MVYLDNLGPDLITILPNKYLVFCDYLQTSGANPYVTIRLHAIQLICFSSLVHLCTYNGSYAVWLASPSCSLTSYMVFLFLLLMSLVQVRVNGSDAAPVYQFLKTSKPGILGSRIKWNFTKFLVNKEGKVIGRYGPTTAPLSIEVCVCHISLSLSLSLTHAHEILFSFLVPCCFMYFA